jgi:DNA-binding LacI/PurR family transcriptional regulator
VEELGVAAVDSLLAQIHSPGRKGSRPGRKVFPVRLVERESIAAWKGD